MRLFLAFNGEGPTDNRFMPIIVERIIRDYLLDKELTAEFSWIFIPKKGSSYDNILGVCMEAKEQNMVLIHRDSDDKSWEQAYQSHFKDAIDVISHDESYSYNKCLIPIIPVRETEAWMLCNKEILKRTIGTTLTNEQLFLNYQISQIETIRDPKGKVQTAIEIVHDTLTRKQRRYAIKIEDLYDQMAFDLPFDDLENLGSFVRFKDRLTAELHLIFDNPYIRRLHILD